MREIQPRRVDFRPKPPPDEPPEVIDPGRYACRIESVVERESRYSSRDYWAFELSVMGVHPKFRLWYTCVLQDHTDNIEALFTALNKYKPTGIEVIDPHKFVGRMVTVIVDQETYSDRLRNTIKGVEPYEG